MSIKTNDVKQEITNDLQNTSTLSSVPDVELSEYSTSSLKAHDSMRLKSKKKTVSPHFNSSSAAVNNNGINNSSSNKRANPSLFTQNKISKSVSVPGTNNVSFSNNNNKFPADPRNPKNKAIASSGATMSFSEYKKIKTEKDAIKMASIFSPRQVNALNPTISPNSKPGSELSFNNMVLSPHFSEKVKPLYGSFSSPKKPTETERISNSKTDSIVDEMNLAKQKLQKFYLKEPLVENDTDKLENREHTVILERNESSSGFNNSGSDNSVKVNNTTHNVTQEQSYFANDYTHSMIKSTPKSSNKYPTAAFEQTVESSINADAIDDENNSNKSFAINRSETNSERSQDSLIDPGVYPKISDYIFSHCSNKTSNENDESSSYEKYSETVFQDYANNKEKLTYLKYGKMSIDEWIKESMKFNETQRVLTEQLVLARLKVSYQFKIITDLINDRAESLIRRGEIIDEKFEKIKKLGEDILNNF